MRLATITLGLLMIAAVGTARAQLEETCTPCTTDAECVDGSGCTLDRCDAEWMCAHDPIAGCVPCTTAADCADGDACTADLCSNDGVCSHTTPETCAACTTAADCNDENPCTTDGCGTDGSCTHTTLPACRTCTTPADCADGDQCTTEACTGGVCTQTTTPGCICDPHAEVCGDGRDNDCDGAADCADTNCNGAPLCGDPSEPSGPTVAEVCGDCIDNDGDHLIDYEDSDCCSTPLTLGLKRMTIKTKALGTRGNGLRVKAKDLTPGRAPFDPRRDDTTLQIKDAAGNLFCTTIAANHWKKKGRTFRFRDKSRTFAGGLKKGRFKVRKDGRVVFRTRGKKMKLRTPSGRDFLITLRVGDACWQRPATLRPKKTSLRFP